MTAGSDPIHKVTIVPRGRALGLMMSLPDKDRYGQTKEWLIGRLAISFGGRVAEELVFGPDKITTGAGSDIQQATDTARRMVTMFGMSERVGMMAVGDQEHEIFLGREMSQRRAVSERTAEIVDDEVKRFLDEAFDKARKILTDNRDLLDRIALTLLERETVDREDLDLLLRGRAVAAAPAGRSAAGTAAGGAGEAGSAVAPADSCARCSAGRASGRVNVTPLTLRSPAALLDELRARGWDAGTATTTAGGVTPLAVRCTGLGDDTLQALVVFGGSHGLDVITGPDWAIIAGSRARLGALARPWFVPEALQELATRVGLALAGGDSGALADGPRRHPARSTRSSSVSST